MKDKRKEPRRIINAMFAVVWQDPAGQTVTGRARCLNISKSGMRIDSAEQFEPGLHVSLQSERHDLRAKAIVRHCAPRGASFVIGLEFCEDTKRTLRLPILDTVDYYEVLQVSRNAEPETIQRVYRIMAARFHPDNTETGDSERFMLLNEAYETISDPEQRARYDKSRTGNDAGPLPPFESKEFVDGIEGETNRRLGILCLLYNQRRSNVEHAGLSLLELEKLMWFPREYLAFAIWYLRNKGFVQTGEHSDYVLTAEGADFMEANYPRNKVFHKLLRG
jgi:hypothetical protein